MRRSPHASRVWVNPVIVWDLLDRLGISQNELARRCGFSPGHLSMLMNGKRSPSPRSRRRLMEVLGVDDFDLLFITELPNDEGREPEKTGAPKRKKGPTDTAAPGCAACRDPVSYPAVAADGFLCESRSDGPPLHNPSHSCLPGRGSNFSVSSWK